MSALRASLLVAGREARERARSKAFLASTALTILMLGFVVAVVVLTDDGPPDYDVGLVGESPPSLAASIDAAATSAGAILDTVAYTDPAAVADALDAADLDAAIIDDTTILLAEDAPRQLEAILDIALRQARKAGHELPLGGAAAEVVDDSEPGPVVEPSAENPPKVRGS